MIEVHPFPPFVPLNASHLVLGTFPTLPKNWKFNSYYPGRSNFFWCILSEIYKHPFQYSSNEEAAEERLALCSSMGIALSDTIYSCQRKVSNSSKDSDLIVVKKMNILKLLGDNPSITGVILTGSSGHVSAHRVFYDHLLENNISFHLNESKPPILGSFTYGKRNVGVSTLYSTSGINIGRYKEALSQYAKYLPSR